MTELEKRLAALYLVVDATVADDIKDHVMAAVKERDRYREALRDIAGELNSHGENANHNPDGCWGCVLRGIAIEALAERASDRCTKCGLERTNIGHDLSKDPYECRNK